MVLYRIRGVMLYDDDSRGSLMVAVAARGDTAETIDPNLVSAPAIRLI